MLAIQAKPGHFIKRIAVFLTVALTVLLLTDLRMPAQDSPSSAAHTPQGWVLTGSKPQSYQTGVDKEGEDTATVSAYLMSREAVNDGFGTLMQAFSASHYLGKRVRLTAAVKSKDLDGWAGLWMRVDQGSMVVGFDNMNDRPIKGTTAWQNYQVTLDVPQDASGISFGVLLNKSGAVWLRGVKFEVVATDVPITGGNPTVVREGPTNLDFKN